MLLLHEKNEIIFWVLMHFVRTYRHHEAVNWTIKNVTLQGNPVYNKRFCLCTSNSLLFSVYRLLFAARICEPFIHYIRNRFARQKSTFGSCFYAISSMKTNIYGSVLYLFIL